MKRALVLAAAALLWSQPALAAPIQVDFSGLAHGEVVFDDFSALDGLVITAQGGVGLPVVFDTTASGTADPDLEGPPWGGNVGLQADLGNLLIVQENDSGCDDVDDVCSSPDDAAGSAPKLIFQFTSELLSFSFLAADIESSQAGNAKVKLFDGGALAGEVGFDEFGVVFGGDNTANQLPDVTVADLDPGFAHFDRVEIWLKGSGGIDDLGWTTADPPQVPEPALSVLLLGALGWAGRRLRP